MSQHRDDSAPTNRLADAISPYLLLHKHNPVDWYPWGEEALEKARAEDKPIFLSVGYSTCYWCHVMERESFSDPAIAELMNDAFVNIKLDREERPDLDEIYMAATQLLTGHGGWPNSVFLTPDLKPYYAGTYFPPAPRHGLPSFRQVLGSMAAAWRERRSDVRSQSDELESAIKRYLEERGQPSAIPEAAVAERSLAALAERFDATHGGFGGAPKFPSPGNLYLLDAFAADGEGEGNGTAARMLDATLDAMLRGGLYDQVGGGFHRYATDRAWKVPHFEKMLYDNGHLLRLYARAYARTGDPETARAVRETAAYLEREMRLPDGGFASALDAETDGFEGGFYVWTREQLEAALEPEDAVFLAPIYGFDGAPFFEGEHYVLHLPEPLAAQAERRRMSYHALVEQLAPLRERLLEAREERPRPLLDDKVLTDWNGMAIAGLAEAGRLLEAPELVSAAARAADFVLEQLWPAADDSGATRGPLRHGWRQGVARQDAFLADYAFLIDGLLALDRADPESGPDAGGRWLDAAGALAGEMIDRLGDAEQGGFFVAAPAPDVLVRSKEVFDGALPAANAVAVLDLLRLDQRTGEARWLRAAEAALRAFAGLIAQQPDATRTLSLAVRRYHRLKGAGGGAGAGTGSEAGAETPVRLALELGETGEGDGGWCPFTLRVEVADGWHLYGEGVASEDGVAATLDAEGVELRDVVWPAPRPVELAPGQEKVPVHEGSLAITGTLRARPATGTETSGRGLVLRYQACDALRCLAPAEARVALDL